MAKYGNVPFPEAIFSGSPTLHLCIALNSPFVSKVSSSICPFAFRSSTLSYFPSPKAYQFVGNQCDTNRVIHNWVRNPCVNAIESPRIGNPQDRFLPSDLFVLHFLLFCRSRSADFYVWYAPYYASWSRSQQPWSTWTDSKPSVNASINLWPKRALVSPGFWTRYLGILGCIMCLVGRKTVTSSMGSCTPVCELCLGSRSLGFWSAFSRVCWCIRYQGNVKEGTSPWNGSNHRRLFSLFPHFLVMRRRRNTGPNWNIAVASSIHIHNIHIKCEEQELDPDFRLMPLWFPIQYRGIWSTLRVPCVNAAVHTRMSEYLCPFFP